jgi:hypothetical protein
MIFRSPARSPVCSVDAPWSLTIAIWSPGDIVVTNRRAAFLARGISEGASVRSSRISTIERTPRSESDGVTAVKVSIGTR